MLDVAVQLKSATIAKPTNVDTNMGFARSPSEFLEEERRAIVAQVWNVFCRRTHLVMASAQRLNVWETFPLRFADVGLTSYR